jgi:hypothetical protein
MNENNEKLTNTKDLAMPSDKQQHEEEPREGIRGFTSAPTADQLKPNDREVFLLRTLWDWQETSSRTHIVLGEPLSS